MTKNFILIIAMLTCVSSFGAGGPRKDGLTKSKVKEKQSLVSKVNKQPPAKKDVYCSTQDNWYFNGVTLYVASCTQCSQTQALADIRASNCAFALAKFFSDLDVGYAGLP